MNFQKTLTKKILFIIMVFVLAINFSFLATPKKAEAIFGVADTAIVYDPVTSTQIGTKTLWDKLEAAVLKAFSIFIRVTAKAFITNVTQATVSWINGGMKGQPAYKANWGKFMKGAGGVEDQIMGQFFKDSSLSFLCSPFQVQVKLALQLGYGASLKDKIGCTLTQVKQNVSDALKNSSISTSVDVNGTTITGGVHDFRNNDGWNEWLSTTIQPQNNPVGAYLVAKDELTTRITTAEGTKELNFLSGSGALNFTKCINHYYLGDNEVGKSPEYTEGDVVDDSLYIADDKYDNIDPVCSVKTPGSVITGTLNKVSGSSVDQLGLTSTLSDGLDAVLSALLNYEMSKLSKGVLDSNEDGYNNYRTALSDSYTTALDNYNTDLSSLYDEQTTLIDTNPDVTVTPLPSTPIVVNPSIYNYATSTWVYDPTTGGLYNGTSTYATSTWVYDPTTGFQLFSSVSTTTNTTTTGTSALDQAKNNALTLINSLLKSESTYQNNYLIAQNILTQGKAVFATSSACNINYNRNDYVLRSLLIRANVISNIDGTSNSDRTIASIPWNLEAIKAALTTSNAKIAILNKASSDVNGAGSLLKVTDAMIPVNSNSFDTDPQSKMVGNIKTWLSGVGSIYNSTLCPIDLIKVLQITTATSTTK